MARLIAAAVCLTLLVYAAAVALSILAVALISYGLLHGGRAVWRTHSARRGLRRHRRAELAAAPRFSTAGIWPATRVARTAAIRRQ